MKFSGKQIVPGLPALILIFITGCSGNGAPAVIGPNGGIVLSNDHKASVTIPAGALSKQVGITVNAVSGTPAGNIGAAYEFEPSGTTFNQPATISITYNPADLPSTVAESSLKLGTLVNNQWTELSGSTVDAAAHTVTGTTTHFSVYGVFAVVPDAPTGLQAIPGDGQMTISWNAASGATSYNLYMAPVSILAFPGSADPGNTGPVQGDCVDENNVPYASFEINPGASAFETLIGDSTGTEAVACDVAVVSGTVTATIDGHVVTLTDGQHHTFVRLTNWASVLPGATQQSGLACCASILSGLTNGTGYFFAVTAVNGSGESVQSSPSWVTPVAGDPGAPSPPTDVTATGSGNQINLSWSASTGGTSYKVYRGGIQAATVTTTSYSDTGLAAGTTYTYTVVACNAADNCSAYSAPAAATTAPTSPTGLAATPGNGQVILTWNPNSASEYVTSYTLYMAPVSILAFPASADLSNTEPVQGECDDENNVPYASFEIYPGASTFETFIGGSTYTTAVACDVAVVSGTVTATIDGHVVTLTDGQHHTFVRLTNWASVLPGATQQSGLACCASILSGLTNGTGYFFAVTAVNASGESAESSPSWATPTALP